MPNIEVEVIIPKRNILGAMGEYQRGENQMGEYQMGEQPLIEDYQIQQHAMREQEQTQEIVPKQSLYEQDSYLAEIERQIELKREFLLHRREKLHDASKENRFLHNVKKDYQKYYDFIAKQKEDQIRSMRILDQYLNDIIVSGKLTEHDIEQTKKDRHDILNEIDKIKKGLETLMAQK